MAPAIDLLNICLETPRSSSIQLRRKNSLVTHLHHAEGAENYEQIEDISWICAYVNGELSTSYAVVRKQSQPFSIRRFTVAIYCSRFTSERPIAFFYPTSTSRPKKCEVNTCKYFSIMDFQFPDQIMGSAISFYHSNRWLVQTLPELILRPKCR